VARHSAAEEVVVYPVMESRGVGAVPQARQEHQLVKEKISRLESMKVEQPEFSNLMQTVLNV
jgi:hypothetical protein